MKKSNKKALLSSLTLATFLMSPVSAWSKTKFSDSKPSLASENSLKQNTLKLAKGLQCACCSGTKCE